MKRTQLIAFAAGVAALSSAAAQADVIDFEGLANGLDVETTATPFSNVSAGVTTTLFRPNGSSGNHIGAAIFDSTPAGPNAGGGDPDLIVPGFGNILILQNNNLDDQTGAANIWDTPNDDEQGGTVIFNFDEAVRMLAIDLIDINGNGNTFITLTDSQGFTREYDVPAEWTGDIDEGQPGFDTLDLTTLADQIGWGSTATGAEDVDFNADDVVSLSVSFNSSGGLDNVSFLLASEIPAPGALALLATAGCMGMRRRRRRA